MDTTCTYFEIRGEDPEVGANYDDADSDANAGVEPGLRKLGSSKDSRDNQAQAVLGFAVTGDGIHVPCWVWPGNTVDVSVIDDVKRDLYYLKIGMVIMMMHTGFNSPENRPRPALCR